MLSPGVIMSKYSAMTTNERLVEARVDSKFESAARAGDRETMILLLESVEYRRQDAMKIVDKLLAHPTRYGSSEPK